MRPALAAEMFGLFASTQRRAYVMLKKKKKNSLQFLKSILVVGYVRFTVVNLDTQLPEGCLHCAGEFGAQRDPYY